MAPAKPPGERRQFECGLLPLQCRQQLAKLKNKDAEVVALLKEYRNRLLNKWKADSIPRAIHVDDVRVPDIETLVRIAPDAYSSIPIELRYQS